MERVVCASMYGDPLHVGHLEYLKKAREIAGKDGKVVVIVNNDRQASLKKGRSFMKDTERMEIIRHLKMVDQVVLSIDQDKTVCRTLELLRPTHFVNGGDQFNHNIPERPICEKLGIILMDGLGEKIQSSSALTGLYKI